MTGSSPSAVSGRWRPVTRFGFRTGRRTLVESLYLLTAPVTAVAGLLLVLGGLCAGMCGLLLPGGSRLPAGALTMARWSGDLERWRIAKVRSVLLGGTTPPNLPALATGVQNAGQRPGSKKTTDTRLWLDVAHAVAVLPVVLVTSVVTGLWWSIAVATITFPLRNQPASEPPRPTTLNVGGARLSLELSSSAEHVAFAVTLGLLLLLFTLPLVTRACVATQAGLGQVLLWDVSALYRRISGLEQERDTARAQTVAAVTAEAIALRRLERDIHDGPQQRLVRLAMELGRAQRHLGSRPEAAREALTDAIIQTQEALDELRVLSRGIAPPILVDRGLREALTALAARSTVPADLDADLLDRRLDAAVETAAYFVVAEALTNVAKHSRARRCAIGLRIL
ncbi:MAG TPA: sensor domain-containing protein [Streptosporangiaceae bacterium]